MDKEMLDMMLELSRALDKVADSWDAMSYLGFSREAVAISAMGFGAAQERVVTGQDGEWVELEHELSPERLEDLDLLQRGEWIVWERTANGFRYRALPRLLTPLAEIRSEC